MRFQRRHYALTTWIFLRLMGLAYFAAFVSFWVQLEGLIGSKGVQPAMEFLALLKMRYGRPLWLEVPSLFWLNASDKAFHLWLAVGVLASLLVLAGVLARYALFACWLIYLSLINVGGIFTQLQWDSLLLESGFVALFLAPWSLRDSVFRSPEPSRFGRWLLYWLLFRLMFSSGVVKLISRDPSWHNLRALDYHFETQPLPSILGWQLHRWPSFLHSSATLWVLIVELLLPFFLWFPGWPRRAAALIFLSFQAGLSLTGYYGFFNFLAAILCLPLLDEEGLRRVPPLRPFWLWFDDYRAGRIDRPFDFYAPKTWLPALPVLPVFLFTAIQLISTITGPRVAPMRNVVRPVQGFRTFNRYGLFAVMTRSRSEVIFEGSDDGKRWKSYEFRYKPDRLSKAPRGRWLHMPRLDWMMWFAALHGPEDHPWVMAFERRLLQNEPAVTSLLRRHPFERRPPKYIRAKLYRYRFSTSSERNQTGRWWTREAKGDYGPLLQGLD